MPVGLIKSGVLPQYIEYAGPIQVYANSPVIFFRTVGGNYWAPPDVRPEQMVRVSSINQQGMLWTFNCEVSSESNGNVYYYIFDTNIGSAGNFGLQVFNENGVAIFNSNNPPLRTTSWVQSVDEYSFGFLLYGKTNVYLPPVAAFSMSVYRRGFTTSDTTQSYSDFYKTFCGITSDNTGIFSYASMVGTALVGGPEGAWTNQNVPYLTIADVSNCPVPFN
jgi:hypothetical protein